MEHKIKKRITKKEKKALDAAINISLKKVENAFVNSSLLDAKMNDVSSPLPGVLHFVSNSNSSIKPTHRSPGDFKSANHQVNGTPVNEFIIP